MICCLSDDGSLVPGHGLAYGYIITLDYWIFFLNANNLVEAIPAKP